MKAFNKLNRQELSLWLMRIESLDLCVIKTLQNTLNVSLEVELIPDKNEDFYRALYKMLMDIVKR